MTKQNQGGSGCNQAPPETDNEHLDSRSNLATSTGLPQLRNQRRKPTIVIADGNLDAILDQAETALAKTGMVFHRGGKIVKVIEDSVTGAPDVHPLSPRALCRELSKVALWKRDANKNKVDPPLELARLLAESIEYPHLPVLRGVAHQPYLRPDGTFNASRGYDHQSGIFGSRAIEQFKLPANPNRRDGEAALGVLRTVLQEFKFGSEMDESAALSAILTAAVRPCLPSSPMFLVRSSMAGSGKTYLCQLISSFASSQYSSPLPFPRNPEECRKLLLAELLGCPSVINFDNLTQNLKSFPALCSALTSGRFTDRILGVSTTASVETNALFLASGNNVQPEGDMNRRVVTIQLAPACELPASRVFSRDVVREVRVNRPMFVAAALTIIKAWFREGSPISPTRALAGFDRWAEVCCQPLLWLGLPGPVECLYKTQGEDPARKLLGAYMDAWQAAIGYETSPVSAAINKAQNGNAKLLRELMLEATEESSATINARKLGRWMRKQEGVYVDGRRFVQSSIKSSVAIWRLIKPVEDRTARAAQNLGEHSAPKIV